MRSLASSILDQRTETEQFLLEALGDVRGSLVFVDISEGAERAFLLSAALDVTATNCRPVQTMLHLNAVYT